MKNIDWLHLFARAIIRLHRYYKETHPLPVLILVVGVLLGVSIMGERDVNGHFSLWQVLTQTLWVSSKIIFTLKIISYTIWEIYQVWIKLKYWATNYAKKEKN